MLAYIFGSNKLEQPIMKDQEALASLEAKNMETQLSGRLTEMRTWAAIDSIGNVLSVFLGFCNYVVLQT